jgi:Signal transduction histidine kinase regulating C4-dicarboxylate transport system
MQGTHRRRRVLSVLALTLGGVVAIAWPAHHWGWQRAMRQETAQLQRQLELHTQALQQLIDRFRTLPEVLALDPQLRAAVVAPPTPELQAALNRRLEEANSVTRASTLTLIDRRGIAIAASNWREPTSNVGENYAFRPYVQQALRHGRGQFYGIGLTTGEPGYFLSQAIAGPDGDIAGVVVIKIELDALEEEWLQGPDVVMASDEHGVVFLASQPQLRYRTLAPLGEADLRELAATKQYGRQELKPLRFRGDPPRPGAAVRLRLDDPELPGPLLWQTTGLPEGGWQLHLLHDTTAIEATARGAALAAGGGWLALSFLLLFVQQRRRLAALRERSRRELEAVLQQHARELRTAQDGIVQAAQQAETGLARSLQHLPQGVVIIDADLRIVAWNSRYIELFRFPPDLIQVGRPIEDVFRFNARRGLLGPGPVEEAIQRRLEHLRSGRPHLRESEKEDGTVLEIRGNPLPDGGFVTSYADITSYKATARELRSLADALEKRIAERTADLEQARQEAERANRHKTRFVAAAVHDLLQPLNAARMFLSALRGRLQDPQALQAADRADNALAAQDAILNSLLDISRLESGTYQVDVRDFELGPLLQALAQEFGILAASRGLRLDWVRTRAVVRTDEALLRRILQNLLSNAVRYTARGRILVGCRRAGDRLRIEILDTGPGIAPNRQREIFEEFRRLDDGGSAEPGAGLGLAIVERIARLLGHPIGLRSQVGRGSVFSVEVPRGDPALLRAPAEAPVPATDDPLLQGCTVWCVDDDARVCEASRALLERWGCRVPLAAGAQAALDLAASGAAAPQLMLLDVQLGEWRGPLLFDELAAHWPRPPQVVLVTADRDEAVRALAEERGWAYLSKPVRPPALRGLMTQLLLRGSATARD